MDGDAMTESRTRRIETALLGADLELTPGRLAPPDPAALGEPAVPSDEAIAPRLVRRFGLTIALRSPRSREGAP